MVVVYYDCYISFPQVKSHWNFTQVVGSMLKFYAEQVNGVHSWWWTISKITMMCRCDGLSLKIIIPDTVIKFICNISVPSDNDDENMRPCDLLL